VDRVAAEIAKKILMLFQHRHLDAGAGQQEAEHHSGRPAADDTAQSAIDALATDAALALIATLPPDQAEAVLLRAVLGLDAQTAGQILGKRAGAVRTAAHRGLRTLARHPALTGERRTRGIRPPAVEGPARSYHRPMPRRLAIGDAQDLVQAERDIRAGIGDQELNFAAMAAVSNIYRAANAIRHHMEQRVLAEEDLSWAAFTVLFVLWIWGDQQTRHLAAEAGVTKGTLTGVASTLERRGLLSRRAHPGDARRVLLNRYLLGDTRLQLAAIADRRLERLSPSAS